MRYEESQVDSYARASLSRFRISRMHTKRYRNEKWSVFENNKVFRRKFFKASNTVRATCSRLRPGLWEYREFLNIAMLSKFLTSVFSDPKWKSIYENLHIHNLSDLWVAVQNLRGKQWQGPRQSLMFYCHFCISVFSQLWNDICLLNTWFCRECSALENSLRDHQFNFLLYQRARLNTGENHPFLRFFLSISMGSEISLWIRREPEKSYPTNVKFLNCEQQQASK